MDQVEHNQDNKTHWEDMGGDYSNVWRPLAKQYMSRGELQFVCDSLHGKDLVVLDVGVGNGRIIEAMVNDSHVEAVYGVDIAKKMVDYCKKKWQGNKKIKALEVCDAANQALPFSQSFSTISSVRVLKYNESWKGVVATLADKLVSGGSLVFSMPNRVSLNIFSTYAIAAHKSSRKELRKVADELGLEVVRLSTFTRVPDVLYEISKASVYQRLIIGAEKALALVLGPSLFGRELFIELRRK